MSRISWSLVASLLVLCIFSSAGAIDKQAAINGASLAVVAPTNLGSGQVGPQSFIRLFSGAGAAGSTSTFTVTVVGIPSGQQYGSSFTIAIPFGASIQYAIGSLVSRAGATPGSFNAGDSSYGIYLQNADAESGYQHIVYNWTTNLFENVSSCGSLLNEQMLSLHKNLVLASLHTSKGPNKIGVGFPSTIEIHNRDSTANAYTLNVYNAGSVLPNGNLSSTTGKQTCQITGNTVPANSTLAIPVSTIEANAACPLDSDEDYLDVIISNASGGAPDATVTHLVHVSQYSGDSNLTDVCAVNQLVPVTNVTTVVAAPSVPTAYCGTTFGPTAYGYATVNFILSVAPNGRARATVFGLLNGNLLGGNTIGYVSGTFITWTGIESGVVSTGTIQNGVVNVSGQNAYGTVTSHGSTAACSN